MWRHIPGVKRPAAESAVAMDVQTVESEVKKKRRYFSNKWRIDKRTAKDHAKHFRPSCQPVDILTSM